MKQITTIAIILISIFSHHYTFSQYLTQGKVIDSNTKKPLAFVNIIFNSNPRLGTTTDIDGKFYFNSANEIKNITFSYVGYKNLTVNLDSIGQKGNLIIKIHPSLFRLQEVIVRARENPANRIIRKVIENKKINNPENISSFRYISYNKFIYDFEPYETHNADSIKIRMDKQFKGGHLFIMESVTERKFIKPDKNEEVILGSKVSGFKRPSFASLATDIQPFSFYNDIITIIDINYLNPISNGSLKKYQFKIEDTLFQKNNDTIFIISFKPQSNKNFEALSGLLYINTNKYAIQNVIAEPFKKGFIDIKIQQKYNFIDNKQWFPEQLNFEMIIRQYPSKKIGMSANGKSYIENVELFPELDKKDFSIESVGMHELANKRDSLFWNKYRTKPLDKSELITYQVIDSIGKKHKFDAKLNFIEKFSLYKIPIKFIDIDIPQSLIYNNFEGFRLGIGAYTNEKILKFFSIGGFFGYGSKDHQWKYGGEFILTLNKNNEFGISCKHQNTLMETKNSGLKFFQEDYYDFRSYIASRMDRIQNNSFSIGFRTLKYAKLNFSLNHTTVSPQYHYQFQPENQQNITNYTYSNVTVNLKYEYKEKIINSLNQRISMGTKYPIFNLFYSRGIKDFYNSEFIYNKIEVKIEESFLLKHVGETKISIEGGFIDNQLPYGLLFTGEGSFDKSLPILMKNYFQTITPYEFLSDQYVNFYFSHNFGSLLFQIKKFKPHITLHQNIGWGRLSNPEYHKMLEFKTKEKVFYESGLQIDNIIKLNYVNIAYLGFGAGIYCRFGSYAYSNLTDNLVIKFSMTFTTK